MPTNRPQNPDETREMRLVGKVIEYSGKTRETTLPEFLARRRLPGKSWRTWDEISFELAEIIGEIVTDGTLRGWAKRYGIPEGTRADGTGDVPVEVYSMALADARIGLPGVTVVAS